MPTTPSGTRFWLISKPESVVHPCSMLPNGSDKLATFRTPSAIPAKRSAVNVKRSINLSSKPVVSAKSAWLAAKISGVLSSKASAIARSTWFLVGVGTCASVWAAIWACCPILFNNSVIIHSLTHIFWHKKCTNLLAVHNIKNNRRVGTICQNQHLTM